MRLSREKYFDFLFRQIRKIRTFFPGIAHHRIVSFAPEDITSEEFEGAMNEASSAGNVILAIENIYEYANIYDKFIPYLDMPHLGIVATTDFAGLDRVLKRITQNFYLNF